MEVIVKNIPFPVNAIELTTELSRYGKITRCELNEHSRNPLWNGGTAWVTFDLKECAERLVAQTVLNRPMYRGRPLQVLRRRSMGTAKTTDTIESNTSFPISSLELGNWKGIASNDGTITNRRRNKKGKKRADKSRWTFLSEWKYPDYHGKPRLRISRSEGALFLEGFCLLSEMDRCEKRIKIKFRTLVEGYRGVILDTQEEENGELSIFLHIKHPPELFQKTTEGIGSELRHHLWSEFLESKWARTSDWTGPMNAFASCKVYKVVITQNFGNVKSELLQLAAEGITHNPLPQCPVETISSPLISVAELEERVFKQLPFLINFKLEALMSHGILTAREVVEYDLAVRLKELIDQGDERVAWCALNQLFEKYYDFSDPKSSERPISLFEVAVRNFKGEYCEWYPSPDLAKGQENKRCAYINQAVITPTKIYFEGPNYETSNRILRQYFEHTDRFIRVTFTEENFERLFFQEDMNELFDRRIRKILKDGFRVAGREYEFLAFSSSGLRERSCWFVASNGEFTARAIRAWMGDFSNIRIPALYASRMGQAFTSTVGTIELTNDEVSRIDDVERNGHTFSDGCGKISPSLAKRAVKIYWGTKVKNSDVPSVFQIRFGGCKGVVAVDPTLDDDVLCIRPSQTKFVSRGARNLEICKAVRNPLPAHLNRQIILLLSSLGVNNVAFIELQAAQEALIDAMMWDREKAREVIQRSTNDLSHIGRVMLGMIEAELLSENEPFLKGILEAKRCHILKDLRYRARIAVPNSFLLMGVMDETGILEPNEVFIQTSTIMNNYQTIFLREEGKNREVKKWTGRVVVTRNPCLHPGDVSVLMARDVPELHHMKNCIVFSQKGDVPIVHTMSGGDLDGDEYFVSFEERIMPNQKYSPMSYERPPTVKLDRPVEIGDVCDFFANFMQNDRLGFICNMHMALADLHEQGPKHMSCVKLAELASKAVDFNKTGTPVDEQLPRLDEYPDFLENKKKRVYESQKILGLLYRRIKVSDPKDNKLLNYMKHPVEVNMDFMTPGYEKYIDDARTMRNEYNEEIMSLMNKYDITTEPELVTGNILHFRSIDGKKVHDVRETILAEMAIKVQKYRKYFRRGLEEDYEEMDDIAFDAHVPIEISDESKAKASAWYFVTYNENMYDESEMYEYLLSFAWIVVDVLLNIREHKKLLELQFKDWED